MGTKPRSGTSTNRNKGKIQTANRTNPKRGRSSGHSKTTEIDWNARYGDPRKYLKKCALAHKATHNFCCVCLKRKSKEIHHAEYGKGDIKGVHTFPVCKKCHIPVCHATENWIKDKQDRLWKSRNTPKFIERLKRGYKLLFQGIEHGF